jgi:hypothetical protein
VAGGKNLWIVSFGFLQQARERCRLCAGRRRPACIGRRGLLCSRYGCADYTEKNSCRAHPASVEMAS